MISKHLFVSLHAIAKIRLTQSKPNCYSVSTLPSSAYPQPFIFIYQVYLNKHITSFH